MFEGNAASKDSSAGRRMRISSRSSAGFHGHSAPELTATGPGNILKILDCLFIKCISAMYFSLPARTPMKKPFREVLATLARHGAMGALATQLLSVAAALLVASVLMFGFNLLSVYRQFDADRAADVTIEHLDKVENHLLAVELTVRGYALSGDRSFVSYYALEREKLDKAIAPLPAAIMDVTKHKHSLGPLRTAVHVRMAALEKLMVMARTGPADVGRAIVDPGVRGTMRDARGVIGSMRQMEVSRREQMAADAVAAARWNLIASGSVLALAFVFGVMGFTFALYSDHR